MTEFVFEGRSYSPEELAAELSKRSGCTITYQENGSFLVTGPDVPKLACNTVYDPKSLAITYLTDQLKRAEGCINSVFELAIKGVEDIEGPSTSKIYDEIENYRKEKESKK
jgi:hypothetical protein